LSPEAGCAVVLFTGDLRVHDNPALTAAVAECEQVVPAFVLDEHLLGTVGANANRLTFLLECLRDLDESLQARGARLVLRRGDPVLEAIKLARRFNARSIHIGEDCTPYARERHQRLARACERERIALHGHPGSSVVAPGALTPTGGGHYRVFTPYWRAWRALPPSPAAPTPRRLHAPKGLPAPRFPALRALTGSKPSPELTRGGESEARRRLSRWVSGGLSGYSATHDDLAAADTSRLSPFLHFGCISPRTVLERCDGRPGAEDFIRQLCWRDFHRQVLADRPDLPRADYRPRGDRWRRSRKDTDAWRAGLTGYPIVDAGMRQLAREGFMHNRARLLVASFLTKTLYIDWRRGAAHFASLLLDADVANNVGNWQWVAGTGNDTRPNRVLNPLRQAERFDPRGDYVRRYVPELAGIEGRTIHQPWLLPTAERLGLGYPAPIVDHAEAARELLARRRG
jgi:deoxyribodipyrimidine photo-lyase